MNVNCLSTEAPFSVFEQFGFQSGRSTDKFAGQKVNHSDNGLVFLDKYINAFMSLKVENYVDLGTHGMFICSVTEARVMSDQDTMTYTYYQKHVKPQPQTEGKKAGYAKSADISMKAMNFRKISSALCANMALWILNQSKDKTKIPINEFYPVTTPLFLQIINHPKKTGSLAACLFCIHMILISSV